MNPVELSATRRELLLNGIEKLHRRFELNNGDTSRLTFVLLVSNTRFSQSHVGDEDYSLWAHLLAEIRDRPPKIARTRTMMVAPLCSAAAKPTQILTRHRLETDRELGLCSAAHYKAGLAAARWSRERASSNVARHRGIGRIRTDRG